MVVEAGFNVHQLVESVLIRDKIFPALGPRLPILPHPDSVVVRTPGRSGQVRSVVGGYLLFVNNQAAPVHQHFPTLLAGGYTDLRASLGGLVINM